MSNLVPHSNEPAQLAMKVKISKSEFKTLSLQRAQEKFIEAKRQQEREQQDFQSRNGPSSEIDETLLRDLQTMQLRFAAVNVRQAMGDGNYYREPSVDKFSKALGSMIGEITTHLAQKRVLALFKPIKEHDFITTAGYGATQRIEASPDVTSELLEQYDVIEDEQPKRRKKIGRYKDKISGDYCDHDNESLRFFSAFKLTPENELDFAIHDEDDPSFPVATKVAYCSDCRQVYVHEGGGLYQPTKEERAKIVVPDEPSDDEHEAVDVESDEDEHMEIEHEFDEEPAEYDDSAQLQNEARAELDAADYATA